MKKILLGLTTTHDSDWEEKIREIDRFNLSEIAIFPTTLEKNERRKLYQLLEKSSLKIIPHVHARHDFQFEEYEYFSKRWQTKLFNLHCSEKLYYGLDELDKFKAQIFIENTGELTDYFIKCLDKTSGLCLDFSHYYDYGIMQKRIDYKNFDRILKKYIIGCCHVSAISKEKIYVDYGGLDKWHFNRHTFESLDQFDYLKEYAHFFPETISLELENSFEEQMKAKEYIETKILTN